MMVSPAVEAYRQRQILKRAMAAEDRIQRLCDPHDYPHEVRTIFATPNAALAEFVAMHMDDASGARLVKSLHEAGAPRCNTLAAFRVIWRHRKAELLRVFPTRLELQEVILYCRVDPPDSIAPEFYAYRGSTGISIKQAALGMSWTPDYRVACVYSLSKNGADGLVIRAKVKRESVVFWDELEDTGPIPHVEVFLRGRPNAVEVYGTPEDWKAIGEATRSTTIRYRELRRFA